MMHPKWTLKFPQVSKNEFKLKMFYLLNTQNWKILLRKIKLKYKQYRNLLTLRKEKILLSKTNLIIWKVHREV